MNAKLESVVLKTADGINEMGILAECHLEAIERLLQKELATLDADLEIARAARGFLQCRARLIQVEGDADVQQKYDDLRAAVEKAK